MKPRQTEPRKADRPARLLSTRSALILALAVLTSLGAAGLLYLAHRPTALIVFGALGALGVALKLFDSLIELCGQGCTGQPGPGEHEPLAVMIGAGGPVPPLSMTPTREPAVIFTGCPCGVDGHVVLDPERARQRAAYLRSFTAPLSDGYDYLSGTAILRLSQYLTPAQARTYLAAFTAAVQQP